MGRAGRGLASRVWHAPRKLPAGAQRWCGTVASRPGPGGLEVLDSQRLALRLRLGSGWRELPGSPGDARSAHTALVSEGLLRENEQQSEAAAALARLPGALAEAREARRRWDAEQERLTREAELAAARAPRPAASSRGWFSAPAPPAPPEPAIHGPVCWLCLGPPPALRPAGCYLYGSVGSGKTTLMDLFCLFGGGPWRVGRQHFHEFSMWLHQALHSFGNRAQYGSDKHILSHLADLAAEKVDVLCIDEFTVTNVADAAILAELLPLLAERHVAFVCTTNRPPEDLYKDGLHRGRYLPALVRHIRQELLVSPISGTDYRAEMLRLEGQRQQESPEAQRQSVFFEGGDPDSALLAALTEELESLPPFSPTEIPVSWGRALRVPAAGNGIARFHFDDVCRRALAAEDFVFLASHFHTVFLHSVPRLSLEEHNEARRFTNLVDALYEHSVRLICHSTGPLDEILTSVEALHNATCGEHDADRLGVFERMYDDTPNFQIQIKELGSREKWQELQDRLVAEEQLQEARRLGRMAAPAAAEGTTGSGWSAAPASADLSAPDQGVAGVMVAAVGSLQESGFAARRAASRLKEMRTAAYLEAARARREAMQAAQGH